MEATPKRSGTAFNPESAQHLATFYERLYAENRTLGVSPYDAPGIAELRNRLDFPGVAERFRMIASETVPVIVTGFGDNEAVAAVVDAIDATGNVSRHQHRMLSGASVSLRPGQVDAATKAGLIKVVGSGQDTVNVWVGDYTQMGVVLPDEPVTEKLAA